MSIDLNNWKTGDGSNYEKLKRSHPCFGDHKANKGRIHLPVSPGCNIQCRFCERSVNNVEQRPGVTSCVLTPQEAVKAVGRALKLCPKISVAGIAGPGDTLASDTALETFNLLDKEYPHLLKCMSTNGLMLPDRAQDIIDTGVDSLTVTVNSVDPETEAKLNKRAVYHGKVYTGTEAAKLLIKNQLEGIKKISAAGITVKVNSVLVIGINDSHMAETAKAVSEAGASIFNIIPLIPQFELSDYPAPTCEQLAEAREKAGKYIDVFRHCQHCRADAVGVPGESEFGSQVYLKPLPLKETFSHG